MEPINNNYKPGSVNPPPAKENLHITSSASDVLSKPPSAQRDIEEEWTFLDRSTQIINPNEVGDLYRTLELGGQYALIIPQIVFDGTSMLAIGTIETAKAVARAANCITELSTPPNKAVGLGTTVGIAAPVTGMAYLNATPAVYWAIKASVLGIIGQGYVNSALASYIAYTSLASAVPIAATGAGTAAWLIAIIGTNLVLKYCFNEESGKVESRVVSIEELPGDEREAAENSKQKLLKDIPEDDMEKVKTAMKGSQSLSDSIGLNASQKLENMRIAIKNPTASKVFLTYELLKENQFIQQSDIEKALEQVCISDEDQVTILFSEINAFKTWTIQHLDPVRRALRKTSENEGNIRTMSAYINKLII